MTDEMIWSDDITVIGLTRLSKGVSRKQALSFLNKSTIEFSNGHDSGLLTEAMMVEDGPAAAFLYNGTIIWRGHPANRNEMLMKEWAKGQSLPDFGPNGLDFMMAYHGLKCPEDKN